MTLIEPHVEAPTVGPGIKLLQFKDAPSGISISVVLDEEGCRKIAALLTGREIVVPSGPLMATRL